MSEGKPGIRKMQLLSEVVSTVSKSVGRSLCCALLRGAGAEVCDCGWCGGGVCRVALQEALRDKGILRAFG